MNELRSARGLFAATGNKAKPIDRVAQDFYATPREAIEAFMAVEKMRLAFFDRIWEPAAGDGAIVKPLRAAGYNVIATDIADRGCPLVEVGDFFDYTVAPYSSAIVTNPPFSRVNWRDGKGRWITHALDVLRIEYMALLLPWVWPGAAGLDLIWKRHPPACVYLMTWKLDFTGQGAPPQLNAWFVWDAGHRGDTVLLRLPRPGRQEKLL